MVLDVRATACETRAARPARPDQRSRRPGPGWPVAMLFVGYPLWWALGIPDVIGLIAAIAMVSALVRRPRLRVPAGFGILLLLLLCFLLSLLLVQVAVPLTRAGADGNRYLTASWRLLWYVKAIVLLLYLGNERERLSDTWICRTLGWMFVYITAGGLLGILRPSFEFHSLAERLLPHGLASTPFVYANIHPVAAERYADYLGGAFRTSAPFPYANIWGLNFACFLPFFVVGWLGRDAGSRRRVVGWTVLGASVLPIVLSLNRGLWVALAAAAVVVAIRAAIAGQLRVIASLAFGAVVVAAVLAASPLGASVSQRLSGHEPTSAHTRSQLASVTLTSVRHESPLLGFGATRDVQGNFVSIAGAATTTCRRCSPPALGTQGQLLLVTFTQGFLGAVLYFGFLLLQFARHMATPSKFATAGLAVLVGHFVTSPIYSADNLAILPIFAAVALLWRAGAAHEARTMAAGRIAAEEALFADYVAALRRHRVAATTVVLVGALIGIGVATSAGPVYRATQTIYAAGEPAYPSPRLTPLPTSLDTVARYAGSSDAVRAMQNTGVPGAQVEPSRLSVAAIPNSRVLQLTYAGTDADVARRFASAAARATLRLYGAQLEADERRIVVALQLRLAALDSASANVQAAAARAAQPGAVRQQAQALSIQQRDTGVQLTAVQRVSTDPGRLLGGPRVGVSRDRQLLDAANGLAVGLLGSAVLLFMLGGANPRTAAILRRRWRTVVLGGLACAALAVALAAPTAPNYTSRVELTLEPLPGAPLSPASRSSLQLAAAMNSEASWVHSAAVVRGVAHRLAIPVGAADAAIDCRVVSNARSLIVEYSAARPELARRGAAILAQEFLRARATAAESQLGAQSRLAAAELNLAARRLSRTPDLRAQVVAYASEVEVFRPRLGDLATTDTSAGHVLTRPSTPTSGRDERLIWWVVAGGLGGLLVRAAVVLRNARRAERANS